ncbi:hypothetical protein SUGI_1186310 [Cryptomeria japonica]|nr:hypothetical protein SUGI_1186310 [Cryptomeria japonica]
MATMENLIGLVNRIQRACTVLGDYGGDSVLPMLWESLPFVFVVGGQSSGKSSIVESILGRDFLPWGSSFVTRRPLVLQLHKIDEGTPEYAEFLHLPNKKITDFAKAVVERQPESIVGDIENMVQSYVEKLNSIILAFSLANQDFESWEKSRGQMQTFKVQEEKSDRHKNFREVLAEVFKEHEQVITDDWMFKNDMDEERRLLCLTLVDLSIARDTVNRNAMV